MSTTAESSAVKSKSTKPTSAAKPATCTRHARHGRWKARRRVLRKTGVQGILERGGKVKAMVVADTKRDTLVPNVYAHVEKGADVFTDELHAYFGLQAEYDHDVINHMEAYVNGNIHTNGIENFWSLLKRTLNGTYVSVEPFHLFRYVDEQAFRFNNRKPMNDGAALHLCHAKDRGQALDLR